MEKSVRNAVRAAIGEGDLLESTEQSSRKAKLIKCA
jgi:hypothetical protein